MNPIVLDNFFEDPNQIRSYALSLDYRKSKGLSDGWLGYRSFDYDLNFSSNLEEKIRSIVSNFVMMKYYFHYCLNDTKKTTPFPYEFDYYKVHQDIGWKMAGIIYLHPNPTKKAGTSFYDENRNYVSSVENKYNRFVCYNAMTNHAATDFFGDQKENGRLTLTFFCV